MSNHDFSPEADIIVASKNGVVGLGFKTGDDPHRWVYVTERDAKALAEAILKNLDGNPGEAGDK